MQLGGSREKRTREIRLGVLVDCILERYQQRVAMIQEHFTKGELVG